MSEYKERVEGTELTDFEGAEVENEPVVGAEAIEAVAVDGVGREGTPGDKLRSLPIEAQLRGTRFVSAQAMQARLFSVYDAAAAAEDALALVQQQLTLTLNRGYYDAAEIESMADQLDSMLALDALELPEDDLVAGE